MTIDGKLKKKTDLVTDWSSFPISIDQFLIDCYQVLSIIDSIRPGAGTLSLP